MLKLKTILLVIAVLAGMGCTKNEELTYVKDRGTVTDIDGNSYKTITIGHPFLDMGTQEWMAENLKVTRFNDGSDIPLASTAQAWHAEVQNHMPHFAWSSYNQQNEGAPYGAFYNFHTVVDSKGLCPTGWRVPTIDDWEKFIVIVGGHSDAGGKIKSLNAVWYQPNTEATDEVEFGALPGGLISGNGKQIFLGESAWFWSATIYDNDNAYAFSAFYNDPILGWGPQPMWDGRSIRCVKE